MNYNELCKELDEKISERYENQESTLTAELCRMMDEDMTLLNKCKQANIHISGFLKSDLDENRYHSCYIKNDRFYVRIRPFTMFLGSTPKDTIGHLYGTNFFFYTGGEGDRSEFEYNAHDYNYEEVLEQVKSVYIPFHEKFRKVLSYVLSKMKWALVYTYTDDVHPGLPSMYLYSDLEEAKADLRKLVKDSVVGWSHDGDVLGRDIIARVTPDGKHGWAHKFSHSASYYDDEEGEGYDYFDPTILYDEYNIVEWSKIKARGIIYPGFSLSNYESISQERDNELEAYLEENKHKSHKQQCDESDEAESA